ncbi:MAG: fumarylacetoacetase [Flavobacteriales bacterium]|nr:fumarylacetoacetase [Flavobacteriales bacterium]
MTTWVEVPENSDFSIYNLPYGIFSYNDKKPRVGVAIGDYVIDMASLYKRGYLDVLFLNENIFKSPTLNRFIGLGKPYWTQTRKRLLELLDRNNMTLQLKKDDVAAILIPMTKVQMHLPLHIGNYTDFYSSQEHATNVGRMFRPNGEPLLPNWKHLPVAYHGRASSIRISGTDFHRPQGQLMPDGATMPIFGPSQQLDFEVEMAFVVGRENELGHPISASDAEKYIFGILLFNDWSARDIQKWEYVPLGPFLSKNFVSTISPWIVTLDALEPFRCTSPIQDVPILPYLHVEGKKSFDIQIETYIKPQESEPSLVSLTNHKYLYWNISQQLAHHTINGCNMQIGDLCASGTISGKEPNTFGSMLELTCRGERPITLSDGSIRTFILDGDKVIMHAFAQKDQIRVGFGRCESTVLQIV